MKWISIKDQQPEGEVLAIGYQHEMIIGYVSEDGSSWICENDNEVLGDVSHWMPLPEPPTE